MILKNDVPQVHTEKPRLMPKPEQIHRWKWHPKSRIEGLLIASLVSQLDANPIARGSQFIVRRPEATVLQPPLAAGCLSLVSEARSNDSATSHWRLDV
jgi:hypothetical protein